MTSFQEIAKAAIDDEAVDESPYSYQEMIYRQLQVPAVVATGFALLLWFINGSPIIAGVGVLITLFTMLPVAGAYLYHKEQDS